VVARRQYMPTQNGAANSTLKTQVSCSWANTFIMNSETTTAPIDDQRAGNPRHPHILRSEAFGLK
jgi:hypothetical protein